MNVVSLIRDHQATHNGVEWRFESDPTFHAESIRIRVDFIGDKLELSTHGLRYSRYEFLSGDIALREVDHLIGHAVDEFGNPEVELF